MTSIFVLCLDCSIIVCYEDFDIKTKYHTIVWVRFNFYEN